ncbi:hypothetical protein BV914_04350 [Neisseria dumasiana]|nr:hypothetical protein BV914_04350 [Neisseria dumasiana]
MIRHLKGISGVICLIFTQKKPEYDEACSGCLLAWGFAKVSTRFKYKNLNTKIRLSTQADF